MISREVNEVLGTLIVVLPAFGLVMLSMWSLRKRLYNGIAPERISHIAIRADAIRGKNSKVLGYALSTSFEDSFALFKLASRLQRFCWFKFKVRWIRKPRLSEVSGGTNDAVGLSRLGCLRITWQEPRSAKPIRVSKRWVHNRAGMYKDGSLHFIALGRRILGSQDRELLASLGSISASGFNGLLYSWALRFTGVGDIDSGKYRRLDNIPEKVWDVYDGIVDNPYRHNNMPSKLIEKLQSKGIIVNVDPEDELSAEQVTGVDDHESEGKLVSCGELNSGGIADAGEVSESDMRVRKTPPIASDEQWYSYGAVPPEILAEILTLNLLCPGVTSGELYCASAVNALILQISVMLITPLFLSMVHVVPLLGICGSVSLVIIGLKDLCDYKRYCRGLK